MPDRLDEASSVLLDRYVLERELGRGGMATVYLARDRKLDRLVALKVLHPELQAALGPERFLREIEVCSRLSHPHILPLHDAGEAAGCLFYVMPYVEAGSLRQRLQRERQLGLEEMLAIVRAVASALDYAHAAGFIHRDIKPENILLARDPASESPHPLIADFGLARAVDAAGGERLTETGLALGTPAYMSPEQGAPGERLDGRSDLYALGCVAYEMLAGTPPFTGPTGQAILARHAVDRVPPLRTVRTRVPLAVEQAIERALAKVPSDRFATAGEFAEALDNNEAGAAPQGSKRRVTRWAVWLVLVGFALIFGGVSLHRSRSTAAMPTPDAHVIAVVPFRVTGRDSSLGYLREGMLDLLAAKLSGTENLRTVDPRTLLSAWRRAGGGTDRDLDRMRALAMARRLGAGRLLEGVATGTGDRIVFNATLTSLSSGQEIQASVEGGSDSLTRLVDELAAQLLALGAGEGTDRLSFLTSTSLPALREYLDGRAALRRGAYPESVRRLEHAMELDSSFALAGLARTEAAIWVGESYVGPGTMLAWKDRHRLGSRDRSLLAFMLTPNWPEWISAQASIEVGEAMIKAAPDSPEALGLQADFVYHYGELTGIPGALLRSRRAYEQALRLDSTYMPSLEHLAEIRLKLGDTVGAREAVHLRLERDSVSPSAARDRWFGRRILRDSTIPDRLLAEDSLLQYPGGTLRLSLAFGGPFGDLESLLDLSRRAAADENTAAGIQRWTRWYFHARGWPGRALQATPDARTPEVASELLYEGLYSDADPALMARLSARIPPLFHAPEPGQDPELILGQFAMAQFELDRGRPQAARGAVRAWLTGPIKMDSAEAVRLAAVAARLLGTELAVRDRLPEAPRKLQELDSLLQAVITAVNFETTANIEAARLWHEQGDPVRALATVRRRIQGYEGPWLLRSLRDEGRYAALAGDHPGAIKAYQHYLRLRSEAEPALQPQVASIRGELEALEKAHPDP
jgi:serine/threonine-protein kinase